MKKFIPIIAIVFFTVSIMSCRPRYLRCSKSRRCEVPVKKVEQAKSKVLFQHKLKNEATR